MPDSALCFPRSQSSALRQPAGTLDFVFSGAFLPRDGDTLTFLHFGSRVGDFANVEFPNFCTACTIVFDAHSATLKVDGVQPVPELPSGLLLGTALLLTMFSWRRVSRAKKQRV